MGAVSLMLLSAAILLVVIADDGDIQNCIDRNGGQISKCLCMATDRPFDQIVTCSGSREQAQVEPLMCVTAGPDDENQTGIVAGECPFTGRSTRTDFGNCNTTLIEGITECMCGESNRAGVLCGECKPGFGLAINTFGLECVNASQCYSYHWAIYFVTDFAALTIFYVLVVALNIRAAAECAGAFVLFAQIISLPFNIVTIQRDWSVVLRPGNVTRLDVTSEALAWLVDITYGIWSLNVPTGAVKKLCPGEHTSSLMAFSVKYVSAVYPLVLIGLSYLLIKLYQRDFKPVSLLWKPFRSFCVRCRRRIDSQTSIVDAFATFVLLSYTKFAHVSMILLAPTPLYDVRGKFVDYALLYDGNIRYFHDPHKWYGAFAILVLVVFVIPVPLLLIFYNYRWFQKGLHYVKLNSHILNMFVNAFQSGYKDSSVEGTRDCRFFAGINFVIRFLIFAGYAFISNYFYLYFAIEIILVAYLCLHVVFQPYKSNLFNKIEQLMILLFNVIISLAVLNSVKITLNKPALPLQSVFYICLFLPAIYMGVYISIWSVRKFHFLCKNEVRFQIDENGQPRTRFGRFIQIMQDRSDNSLPSPVEDRESLIEERSIEAEYSSSYVNYCETPVGTNNTTDRSTVPTNDSRAMTAPSTNNSTGQSTYNPVSRSASESTGRSTNNSTGRGSTNNSTGRRQTGNSTGRSNSRLFLSLMRPRHRQDFIALTETS